MYERNFGKHIHCKHVWQLTCIFAKYWYLMKEVKYWYLMKEVKYWYLMKEVRYWYLMKEVKYWYLMKEVKYWYLMKEVRYWYLMKEVRYWYLMKEVRYWYLMKEVHTCDLSRSGIKLPIWRLPLRPPDEVAKIPIFMNFDFSRFPKAKTCFPITADACFI